MKLRSAFTIDMQRLPMWTIYDHPRDFPHSWVARMFYSLPQATPTALVVLCDQLEPLQRLMELEGCAKLDRSPGDDARIVETWIM